MADGQQAADTSCSSWSPQDQMIAEPEPFFLSAWVALSGASSLHPCLPRSVTDSEHDWKQTTTFIKI